jgi:hypothetical protein
VSVTHKVSDHCFCHHDLLPLLTIALSAPNSGCQCNNLLVIVGKQSYNSLCPGLLMHFWNLWENSSNNIQFQPWTRGGFETFKLEGFQNLCHCNQGAIESLKPKIIKQTNQSIYLSTAKLKTLSCWKLWNYLITTHKLYCTLTTVWQHNLLIMDKDTTAVTESSKVFRESARHSIFGLHSKATLEFLPETLTGQKLYHCHCRGTQRNPKCRSTDIAFYVLWKISYTPQWGPSHHLPNCNPRLL